MTAINWLRRVFGNRPSRFDADAEPRELEDPTPNNPFPEPVTIQISDVIDLHTIPPREVKKVVEEYLSEARTKGFGTVRIIHGKGIGVQRQMVHVILKRTPFVVEWHDAPPDAGGLGATIARLGEPQQKPTA